MSHIKNIEIKNFKSIRHAKIEDCRRVNVFIGYPNVGKSNILEALGLLTFVQQKRPVGLGQMVRFDRFSQLFNFSNINSPAEISFNDLFSLYLKYVDEEGVSLQLRDKRKSDDPFFIPNFSDIHVGRGSLNSGSTDGIDDFSGFYPELKNLLVKPYKFISGKYFENSKSKKYSAIELKVPNGDNLSEVIVHNKPLFDYFSELLSEYNTKFYNDNYELKLELKNRDSIPTLYPLSLLADTLIRLMFFKTAIESNKNTVLLFEEPEAHMFPPYISKFTTDVMYGENNNQYFIATHSPFVLSDFMEKLDKVELAIYVVRYKKETGETLIDRLNEKELHEAAQFGYDFFMNLENFIPAN
jgi:AAA15 family ATPase/GTPase